MKNKIASILILCLCMQTFTNAQDKKIPFNKGVIKICSSKSFTIKGYDGNEVIVKSLHTIKNKNILRTFTIQVDSNRNDTRAKIVDVKNFPSNLYRIKGGRDSVSFRAPLFISDNKRGEGLKKLGKKAEAEESGIFLKIEVKGDELSITDDNLDSFFMTTVEKYEITIPNSVKLIWNTQGCEKKKTSRMYFFKSSSEIQDFKGEVEISTTLNELNLKDVTGPVTINTIGGNVTIEFDKTTPKHLYSVYSNNGFIDVKIPTNSDITIDASADEILSDLDFNIVSDEEVKGAQQMNLKLGNGKVKMKLNAGFGSIYLRKK